MNTKRKTVTPQASYNFLMKIKEEFGRDSFEYFASRSILKAAQQSRLFRQLQEDSPALRALVGGDPNFPNYSTRIVGFGSLSQEWSLIILASALLLQNDLILYWTSEKLQERMKGNPGLRKEYLWIADLPLYSDKLSSIKLLLLRLSAYCKNNKRTFGGKMSDWSKRLNRFEIVRNKASKVKKPQRKRGYTDHGNLPSEDSIALRTVKRTYGPFENALIEIVRETREIEFQSAQSKISQSQIDCHWENCLLILSILNLYQELEFVVPKDLIVRKNVEILLEYKSSSGEIDYPFQKRLYTRRTIVSILKRKGILSSDFQ